MNPAFSVILFTTLSGAGYGLLAWLGLFFATASPTLYANADVEWSTWFAPRLIVVLAIGFALTAIGLASSTFHLGKPQRAWRAFSQWRTSWLSREGVLALLTWLPVLGLVVLAWRYGFQGSDMPVPLAPLLGACMAFLSVLTVACTGMIYASLKPVPAWRHPLVVPVYLVFSLVSGLVLFDALSRSNQASPDEAFYFVFAPGFPILILSLLFVLTAMKLAYWRGIDRIALPAREAATALEGFGRVATFERPHTEANYLTHEMGFVLARKHSRKLRVAALVLVAALPASALIGGWAWPSIAMAASWTAMLSLLAGAFVERWLFFAEAKHMVMLYY
ncbi:MAG TPA: DmsC/YnfH family molybdoenzyme membrane anchor subunit [Xanthomonadaceae bacterium]